MLTAVVARSPVFGGKLKKRQCGQSKSGERRTQSLGGSLRSSGDRRRLWAAKRGRDALQIEWDEGPMADFNTKSQREQYANWQSSPDERTQGRRCQRCRIGSREKD